MVNEPTAAVLVSNTLSLASTPCLRLTQGKGIPAYTCAVHHVTPAQYSQLALLNHKEALLGHSATVC